MPEPSMLVVGTIGFAAFLLLVLFLRPAAARSGEGKILAVVAFVVAPALAAYGGFSEHRERTKSTDYCLSCHALSEHGKGMRTAGATSLPAVHYQNHLVPAGQACYSCHVSYGFTGDRRAQIRGMKHIVTTYFGSVPDTIRMARRYRNRECFRCHLGARSFEEAPAHQVGRFTLKDMKSGRVSCTRSGCHDVVHRQPRAAVMAAAVAALATEDPLRGLSAPATGSAPASAPPPPDSLARARAKPEVEPKNVAGPTAKAEPAALIGPMPVTPAATPAVAKPTTVKTTKSTTTTTKRPAVKKRRARR